MMRARVVHLCDDTTAGGVMRVLDHIVTNPAMAVEADHILHTVDRNSLSLGAIEADVIVSHLAISWRGLPMLAILRAQHPRIPLVHVEHSYTQGFVVENVRNPRRFACLLRLAYRLFDRVVAVSHAQGRWLCDSGAVPAVKCVVIQSCVDLAEFRAIAPTTDRVRVVGAIGRLDRQKGFDALIAAFRQSRAPDIALHLYGEGAEEPHLRRLAQGDPRIQFKGFASDPTKALAAVDVVAMPSRWEAYGLVALETLAAGRVLWVSGVDGLADHLAHGAICANGAAVADWRRVFDSLHTKTSPVAHIPPDTRPLPEQVFAARWHDLLSCVGVKLALAT